MLLNDNDIAEFDFAVSTLLGCMVTMIWSSFTHRINFTTESDSIVAIVLVLFWKQGWWRVYVYRPPISMEMLDKKRGPTWAVEKNLGWTPWGCTLAPAKPHWLNSCSDTWLSIGDICLEISFVSAPVLDSITEVGPLFFITVNVSHKKLISCCQY
jgi:hypothetical protein